MTQPRILIVEDEAILALGLQTRLKLLGYEVIGAADNARQAVELTLDRRPDLILMDIRLRGPEDGILAAERIRDSAQLPVIFLSAFSDDETLKRAQATEPFGYLIKPCQDRELRAAIEMALSRHASELRRADQTELAVVDALDSGIIVGDVEGLVSRINPAGCRLTGWSEAEALGQSLREVLRFVDVDAETTHPGANSLPRLLRRDGTILSVEVSCKVLNLEAGGPPAGLVFSIRDITKLQQHVSQRLSEAKTQSLSTLAGGMAHAFNNLLTPVTGYASLLQASIGPNPAAAAMLERIEESARRASELTEQLLAYAGGGRVRLVPLCLNRLVREVVAARAAPTDLPRVVLELTEPLPPVRGERRQLSQLVAHLLANALEALVGQKGSVTIRTGTAGNEVFLAVVDTGCGMTEDVRLRVFDPFFTTKFTGRGLGLAAVQGIVRGHRGTLELHSKVDHGTTVHVTFPADRPPPLPEIQVQTHSHPSESRSVLVVDDEPAIRMLMERSLTLSGVNTFTADGGAAAVELFAKHASEIELVILDMMMPGMGGRELAEQLREYRPDVKLIPTSGHSDICVQEAFAGIPLAGVLAKPFNPKQLIDLVRSFLGSRTPSKVGI